MASEWAKNEFGDATLGDKRLTDRLANIADSLINLPESSINQVCGSWSEAKWAYRFFQNENVKESDILASHTTKTVERIKAHKKILVIQDTSNLLSSKRYAMIKKDTYGYQKQSTDSKITMKIDKSVLRTCT
ncbi:Transposase for transposon Tn5 [Wolbachia endosymbiont of Cylisticus convexus]|nr:Transposase for transposon Tn5 [Wolbachia endosymbiont of Cylisticus convexus]